MAASINIYLSVLILVVESVIISLCDKPPNIVFILTDDQDVVLGGMVPMAKTNFLLGDNGIIFKNMFVSSPLCCPSRSTILTGKFIHNHNALNNSVDGGCGSKDWQNKDELTAFPVILHKQGYTNFFSGKYLNTYGFKEVGGVKHVPPGWDWWNGLVGNSVYYNYSMSINGKEEKHGDDVKKDYLTDVIHKQAMAFLNAHKTKSSPFFMMLAPPASHSPFTPEPKYIDKFEQEIAPRNGSFNVHGEDKHWLLEQAETPMSNDTTQTIDDIFRNRWRTLLSVDDLVEDVITTLDTMKILDNTYVFFSSDNGFHLGQFSLPYDKRQFYDFDIRVPLMVRGPGIEAQQLVEATVLNTDFAPTFIELAGGVIPDDVDGLSMVPLFKNVVPVFRTKFLVEHYGESEEVVKHCPRLNDQQVFLCDNHCVCEDSVNNTYACVVETSPTAIYKYCQMQDSDNYVEVYDLLNDPSELTNIVNTAPSSVISMLSADLAALSVCTGHVCKKLQTT